MMLVVDQPGEAEDAATAPEPADAATALERADAATALELASAALALARRFAAGAVMWCVAPRWPAHGRHVAVEFVHPVIVGKRALPAVYVEGPDIAGALRLLCRPGDVLVVISGVDDPGTIDVLRRSEAWGLTRLWLGAGAPPPVGRAEHVAWQRAGRGSEGPYSGGLVLLYHLLWELTHVVFEHPGLLDPEESGADEVCITCSDGGRVAEVRAVRADGTAEVVMGGVSETLDVSLVEPVVPGDLVLAHAGVALTTLECDRP
jgi:hydrogenase maturation factor